MLARPPACACVLAQPDFSIVQRKVLTPNDFEDLDEVASRILGFQKTYEKIATPFEWKFTRSDLSKLIRRLQAESPRRAA